jgi:hypothetical protein
MSDAAAKGSCVGYEVRSTLEFRTLRAGGGTPLYVDEGAHPPPAGDVVATWKPRPGNPFHGRLIKNQGRYAFWASDAGWYVIDPAVPSIKVTHGPDPVRREVRLFGVPAAVCAFEHGDISIHASAVEVFGQGVLLAGPSMYGKTTLAAAFAQAGHRLLSEDTTRCRTTRPPAIFPGPAILRLRSDVAERLHIPGASALAPQQGRVPLIIDESSRGGGGGVPLRAILLLRPSFQPATLERVAAAEAVRDVFALTFRVPTDASRAACFARVTDLTAQVQNLRLHRPMTIEALHEVVMLVERHLAVIN